jgi:hypothetical protein
LALAVAGAAGAWYWWNPRATPEEVVPAAASAPASTGSPDARSPFEVPVPALAASDAVVRSLVATLSAHPQLAVWLATDDLVRRFVNTVVALARGSSPASHLESAAPVEPFSVVSTGGRTRIADASYRRYDVLAEAFLSLDAAGASRLYVWLQPLFEEAYAELGISERSFDETMALAVRNVLAVEVPPAPLEVVPSEGRYLFRDPRIEARTPAEKQLLRLGPETAPRIQNKLRELDTAIGISRP